MTRWRVRITRRRVVGAGLLVGLAAALFSWRPVLVAVYQHRARQALRARQECLALDQLRAALRWDAENAETHFLLARTYRRLGDLERVPGLLRRARQLGGDPQRADREAWLLLAQAGRLREAEPHLADLLEDPRDDGPDICEAFVHGYFLNLQVQPAVQLLDAWEKDFPQDPQPHFMRGFLLQSLARWGDAAAAYRKGLARDPTRTTMRCRLAEVLTEMQQFAEAESLLRDCLEAEPENANALYALADCLYAQGRVDQAGEVLERLLSRQPEHFEARRLLGQVELDRGRFARARDHLERAARQRPYETTTRNALGKALRALGRPEEAQPHFDYVAEAEPSLERMERLLPEVVQRPNDPELRCQIGLTLLRYGSPEDAAQWLLSVLELDPNHAGARQGLAAYYAGRGEMEKAAEYGGSGAVDPSQMRPTDEASDTP